MKALATFLTTALALAPIQAVAHDWDDEGPWAREENWQPITETETGAIVFLSYVERAGAAVSFETIIVTPKPDEHGADQFHAHWLADCNQASYRETHRQDYGPKGPRPPPIRFQLDGASTALSGTAMRVAVDHVCGRRPASAEDAPEPYQWARERFKARQGARP